jgi:hypothetical protein
MAASEILGLFTTPEQYQLAQQQAEEAQAIQYANLSPMARANYGTFRAGQQLGGAIGGALGGQDPMLQKISQRQQLIGMIDPSNPDTYPQAIQAALRGGDQEAAFLLRNEMMKVRQQAQEQQLQNYKVEDIVTQRDMTIQARTRQATANQLFGQLKNPDGTINEQVKNQLLTFPEGRALITEQAKVLPALRQLGASNVPEVNPFDVFVNDPKLPPTLKVAARQYQKAFNEGTYSPEDVDKFVERLASKAESSAQYAQTNVRLNQNADAMQNIAQQSLELRQQLARQAKADAGGSDKVQSSKVTPDGTVILVFKNGKTSVTSPQGEELKGQARADAIKASEEFGANVQQDRALGRGLGDLSAKQVNQAFQEVGKIKKNIGNIDDAIKAIDAGANTGVIASRFPNLTAASVQLANIRNTLGLDVIGSVTFGALSEGELNLALDTALPTNLAPKDLRKYLVDKKTAQTKLSGYLTQQATYLSKKGNSLAGWLEKVENQASPAPSDIPADVVIRRKPKP